MIQIQELTRPKDRHDGFRSIEIVSESRESRFLAVITLHRADNIALDGDADLFVPLPGCIGSNHEIATLLLKAAEALLAAPMQESLAPRTIVEDHEPVPFKIVEKPNCHED